MSGGVPKASVIVPCWNVEEWVEDAISSVLRGSFQDFEIIAVDDGSTDGTGAVLDRIAASDARVRVIHQTNGGVSCARNRGLDAARGGYVFFIDPDDTCSPEMLSRSISAMEIGNVDYCVFAYRRRNMNGKDFSLIALKGDYRYRSNAEIRAGYLSRMFGYSFANVRMWYAGTPLFAHREEGYVWRCVYRRSLIEAHNIRFDERIILYEDAMFNCEYMLYVQAMFCLAEPMYDYTIQPQGAVMRLRRSRCEFMNKLAILRRRQEINRRAGGTLGDAYAASCVFALLEMFALLRTVPIGWSEGRRIVREYAADSEVRTAIRTFPLSWRKPVLALAVLALRVFGAGVIYAVCWTLFAPFRRRVKCGDGDQSKDIPTATLHGE